MNFCKMPLSRYQVLSAAFCRRTPVEMELRQNVVAREAPARNFDAKIMLVQYYIWLIFKKMFRVLVKHGRFRAKSKFD